jgi:Protein of unknown function (DUF2846)
MSNTLRSGDGRRLLEWIGVVSVLALAGCTTVPTATPEEAKAAARMEVPPGRALIYVVRPGTMDLLSKYRVKINGKVIGELPTGSYFVVESNPGEIEVASNVAGHPLNLSVAAEAGQRYYVEQQVHVSGFYLLFYTQEWRLRLVPAKEVPYMEERIERLSLVKVVDVDAMAAGPHEATPPGSKGETPAGKAH